MNGYTVRRIVSGTVTMGDGSTQPNTRAFIYAPDGKLVTSVRMNATTFCCAEPIGHGSGIEATDEQVIVAVLGDEDIFSGAPSWPGHHDAVTA